MKVLFPTSYSCIIMTDTLYEVLQLHKRIFFVHDDTKSCNHVGELCHVYMKSYKYSIATWYKGVSFWNNSTMQWHWIRRHRNTLIVA